MQSESIVVNGWFASGAARLRRLLVGGALAVGLGVMCACALAADDELGGAGLDRRVADIVRRLDADEYLARQEAQSELDELARQPRLREPLAKLLRRATLESPMSFEVRETLTIALARLPAVPPAPVAETSNGETARLVASVESDSFAERTAAVARLEWLVSRPEVACDVLSMVKPRLADRRLPTDARRRFTSLADRARAAWLLSEPSTWQLDEVGDETIGRWIDDLTAPLAGPAAGGDASDGEVAERRFRREIAERELLDLLARDAYVPRVLEHVERRRRGGDLDDEAVARLDRLGDWTLPAMVAEFWQAGRHTNIQHLIIGRPNRPEMALRPSLFDWIDDHTAHCVSGNTLSSGYYAVGVFIPHPEHEDAQFHLINLPTARHRLRYEHQASLDMDRRLAEISRRTVERLLALRQPLDGRSMVMLRSIDAPAVSWFVPRLMMAVDDRPRAPAEMEAYCEPTSHHGALCHVLAEVGTQHCAASLVEADRLGRILPPTDELPYDMPCLALLAIAARDPWDEVDAWLAERISDRSPICLAAQGVADQRAPEMGATSAAMLLARRDIAPWTMGLEAVDEPLADELGLTCYRFVDEAARGAVLGWWSHQNAGLAQTP